MSAFTRMPIPPLPERALGSTDALYDWAQPLVLRTWSKPYWHNVYFLLAFKIALAICSNSFVMHIMRKGEFWLFRSVKARRGTLIIPKATDACIFFGACFVVVDAAYRIRTIQWFRGPTYEPFKNYMLLEGLRLVPVWLSAWAYLCGSSLVWPLDVNKLRPLYWHLGLFGVPILFVASFIPGVILGDRQAQQAQAVYLPLERELLAAPGAALTQGMKDQALLVHYHAAESAFYSGCWAAVGAFWVVVLLIGELIVGSTLLSRLYTAYSQIPAYTAAHHTWSILQASVADTSPRLDVAPPSPDQKQKVSRLRMAKYFAGIAPLATTANEQLEPLPPFTTRRVLRSFFFHTLIEFVSLCTMQIIISSAVIYLASSSYVSLRENVYDATYGNGFGRVNATYHFIELWVVVVLGSTFIISMLKRQVFPLRISADEQHSSAGMSRLPRMPSQHGMRSFCEHTDSPVLNSIQLAGTFDWPTDLTGELKTPSHSLRSAASSCPVASSDFHGGSQRSSPDTFQTAALTLSTALSSEDDVSWYAGRNVGRSIVMNALASGSRDNIGIKAAWRTDYASKESDRRGLPPHKFVTPHGTVSQVLPLETLPHQDLLPVPASSPRSLQSGRWFGFPSSPSPSSASASSTR